MKIFPVGSMLSKNISRAIAIASVLALASCATSHEQYGKNAKVSTNIVSGSAEIPAHRFYLVGDAGYADNPHSQRLLSVISERLKQEGKQTTLLLSLIHI